MIGRGEFSKATFEFDALTASLHYHDTMMNIAFMDSLKSRPHIVRLLNNPNGGKPRTFVSQQPPPRNTTTIPKRRTLQESEAPKSIFELLDDSSPDQPKESDSTSSKRHTRHQEHSLGYQRPQYVFSLILLTLIKTEIVPISITSHLDIYNIGDERGISSNKWSFCSAMR